jgi:DNA-directed RNA polymerase II subunit RPB1
MINLKICGVEHLKRVSLRGGQKRVLWNDEEGFTERNEWVLETEGSNIIPVLTCDYVDETRTISNDIVEVFSLFGIEAARGMLLKELRTVINFDGSYVNYRHLALLVDVMTMQGYLMPIERYGINRSPSGPLLRCSFENTVDTLMDAAVFAEHDILNGATENIMLGQLPQIGTGFFDLLLDEKKIIGDVSINEGSVTPYTSPFTIDRGESTVSSIQNAFSPPYFSTNSSIMSESSITSSSRSRLSEIYSSTYSPTNSTVSSTSLANTFSSSSYSSVTPAYLPTSPEYILTSPSYTLTRPAYSPSIELSFPTPYLSTGHVYFSTNDSLDNTSME